MMQRTREHHLADWLDLHDLSPITCRRILDAASDLALAPPDNDPSASVDDMIDLDSAWQGVVESMRQFFPEQVNVIDSTWERTARILVTRPGTSRRALTIDNGSTSYPTIVHSFTGQPSDWLVLAHEFAHALQIRASEGRFVSPIMREVCAFVGEWALLSAAMSTDAARYSALSRIWHSESQLYFGPRRRRLISALLRPETPYSYSWNYPIARFLSIRVQARYPRKRVWEIFEGQVSVDTLVWELGLA